MKVKTSELKDKALDWAVEKCLWVEGTARSLFEVKPYSTDWSQGGPIIEREGLWVRESAVASPAIAHLVTPGKKWFAYAKRSHDGTAPHCYYGETFLIAAMRCFVASRLGDEVEIPEELL